MNLKQKKFLKKWLELREKENHPQDLKVSWQKAFEYKLCCDALLDFIIKTHALLNQTKKRDKYITWSLEFLKKALRIYNKQVKK